MYVKIAKYLTKMTERRIEHHCLQYFIILIIVMFYLPFKYYTPFLSIIIVIYFRTIKVLLKLASIISIYYNKNYNKKTEECYKLSRSIIYDMKVIENFHELPTVNSIIICNYPVEMLEYAVQWLIPRKISVVMIDELKGFMGKFGVDMICVKNKKNYNPLKLAIKEKIKSRFIFSYINKPQSRLHRYDLGRVRSGIFHIAYELGIPITPIAIDCVDHYTGVILNQKFQIKVGTTEIISNPCEYIKQSKHFFRTNIKKFKNTKYKS